MTMRQLFSEEEWESLQFAALAAFFAVASAKGKVSQAEYAILAKIFEIMRGEAAPSEELAQELMISVQEEFEVLIPKFSKETDRGVAFENLISEGAQLSAKAPPEQADAFRRVIAGLATSVAKQRRLGIGIGAKEKRALATVTNALRFSGPEFRPFSQ